MTFSNERFLRTLSTFQLSVWLTNTKPFVALPSKYHEVPVRLTETSVLFLTTLSRKIQVPMRSFDNLPDSYRVLRGLGLR